MKKSALFFFMLILTTIVKSQNVDAHFIDSVLSIPQTLELKLSSPQPRLKEKLEIFLDVNYIRAHIFKTELGKFDFVEDVGNTDDNFMILKVAALEKGKQSLGPLAFSMNGTKYKTNLINYEVIDALPDVDNGLWIRKVSTGDSSFCIIIEQRIPADSKILKISEDATKYWSEASHQNIFRFKNSYDIEGLKGGDGINRSGFDYFINSEGIKKEFMSGYSLTYFRITHTNKKIVFSKDMFENIPSDFTFEDILVQ